jgi:hypothetical protein
MYKREYITLSAPINTGASAQSKQQAAHANCTAILEPISRTSFYHPPPIDNKILIDKHNRSEACTDSFPTQRHT